MMEFNWTKYLNETGSVAVPEDFLSYHNPTAEAHSFAVGMKVEALSPVDMNTFCPATVTKIFNNLYFLVVIDDHIDDYKETKMAWMCDNMHRYIYPIGWAHRNKLELRPPKVWKEGPFDWEEYLSMTASVPAPDYCFGNKYFLKGIEINMKLEAASPINHEEIHVANIVSTMEHMLYVELLPIEQKYWYSQDSDMLLPVGWCDSNDCERGVPDTKLKELPKPKVEPKTIEKDLTTSEERCGKIYFNYKCYAGPSLNRSKLSQLPKHVGPGPLLLVLKEALNKIISASYQPVKLLKDWATTGPAEEGMKLELLRAKFPSKIQKTRSSLHAHVPIVTTADQVESFCRDVCVKLQACPYVFGPTQYPDQCPHNCRTIKKSTFHRGAGRRSRTKSGVKGQRNKKRVSKQREEREGEEKENREGQSVKSEHSASSEPRSEPGTRPTPPDSCDDKRALRKNRESRIKHSASSKPRSEPGTRPTPPDSCDDKRALRKNRESRIKHSASSKPRSEPGTRPTPPDSCDDKRAPRKNRESRIKISASSEPRSEPGTRPTPPDSCDDKRAPRKNRESRIKISASSEPRSEPGTRPTPPDSCDDKRAPRKNRESRIKISASSEPRSEPGTRPTPPDSCDDKRAPRKNRESRIKISASSEPRSEPGTRPTPPDSCDDKRAPRKNRESRIKISASSEPRTEPGTRPTPPDSCDDKRAPRKNRESRIKISASSEPRTEPGTRPTPPDSCDDKRAPRKNRESRIKISASSEPRSEPGTRPTPPDSCDDKRAPRKNRESRIKISASSEPRTEPGTRPTPPDSCDDKRAPRKNRESRIKISASSEPRSEPGTRPTPPDSCDDKRAPRKNRESRINYPKMEMKTRGAKFSNFVETIYGNSCATKRTHVEIDTVHETNASSCNSRDAKNIPAVSDGDEPDLKKPKSNRDDPLISDNIMFDTEMAWIKEKLSRNPAEWSIDDVHEYLSNTEDCKLIADKIKQEKVNGEAFIMLDLDLMTNFLHMKKEFALQLYKHVRLVRCYYDNFKSGEM